MVFSHGLVFFNLHVFCFLIEHTDKSHLLFVVFENIPLMFFHRDNLLFAVLQFTLVINSLFLQLLYLLIFECVLWLHLFKLLILFLGFLWFIFVSLDLFVELLNDFRHLDVWILIAWNWLLQLLSCPAHILYFRF